MIDAETMAVIDKVSDIWFAEDSEYADCTQYEILRDAIGYKGAELERLNAACYDYYFGDEDEDAY